MLKLMDEKQDSVTLVAVGGRLDGTGAPELEAHCSTLIADGNTRLVLDFGGVDYISSAGLRSLLVVAKQIKAAGGGLALCSLTAMVREVLEISGFDKILTVATDQTAALATLA